VFRVISLNANGIRAAARKGFFEWLASQNADVVCLQETRAQQHQLSDPCFMPEGYHCYYQDAVRKGYSGVAVYSRHEPEAVVRGFGVPEFDDEGRYLELRLGRVSVVSVYLPSGSSGDLRQESKWRFLDAFVPHLEKLRRRRCDYILCGDWNIAHKEIDLRNWRANRKNSGFLPEERRWLDDLFDKHRFVDGFRVINQEADQYTWWSNRGRAWDKNVGWRIDYQIVTPGLREKIRRVDVYKAERFSDHAPLIMDYDLDVAGAGVAPADIPAARRSRGGIAGAARSIDFPGRAECAVDHAAADHEPEQQDARKRQHRG
jgi:exodeoxyribonuclease III